MKPWQTILITILCTILVIGVIFLFFLPQRGEPIQLVTVTPDLTPHPSPTVVLIQVHVAGAVSQPGVYSFPPGARNQDAINAAGGSTADADLERLNLSAFLTDGERLYIPIKGQPIPTDETSRSSTVDQSATGLVNINTANVNELMTLPGIGSSKADAILIYRTDHGPFTQIEELLDVPGIGSAILEDIRPLITLGP
ncbi:MAG: ComEA family DNA-binding protein [Anaerolineaceae bacterium]